MFFYSSVLHSRRDEEEVPQHSIMTWLLSKMLKEILTLKVPDQLYDIPISLTFV